MKPVIAAKVAENWFRSLDHTEEHLFEVVLLETIERNGRGVFIKLKIRSSHDVYFQIHVVSNLDTLM